MNIINAVKLAQSFPIKSIVHICIVHQRNRSEEDDEHDFHFYFKLEEGHSLSLNSTDNANLFSILTLALLCSDNWIVYNNGELVK